MGQLLHDNATHAFCLLFIAELVLGDQVGAEQSHADGDQGADRQAPFQGHRHGRVFKLDPEV